MYSVQDVPFVSASDTVLLLYNREEHIHRKVDAMIKEAKAKMAKGDKKGKHVKGSCLLLPLFVCLWSILSHDRCECIFVVGALFAMKRKKLYEAEADKIQNVKMTLETQVINLESAAQNAETFKAMEAGSKTMKKIRTDVGIDKVDDIMDEIKEEMEMASEINNAIAQPVDPLMTDEDELLEELNMLEASDLEAELLAPPASKVANDGLSLPTVPDSKLPALEKKEADDLKALEAELAGL